MSESEWRDDKAGDDLTGGGMMNVTQLLAGFHDDRARWAACSGLDDVPSWVPVFASSETIELLAGGDYDSSWTPYNRSDGTLFWHPVLVRDDLAIGEFRFVPVYRDSGPILFSGGPFAVPQVRSLTRFPAAASVVIGKWQHDFFLGVCRTEMGAVYLQYLYRETSIARAGNLKSIEIENE